jgi:hypothetical protein
VEYFFYCIPTISIQPALIFVSSLPSIDDPSFPSRSRASLVTKLRTKNNKEKIARAQKKNPKGATPILNLCEVGRGRDVASTTSPVDVDVLALGQRGAGVLRLHTESVGTYSATLVLSVVDGWWRDTEVVTLGLQKVCRQVLGPVTVIERQGSGKGGRRDTELNTLSDSTSPARLGSVDGRLEEVVEEQVFEVRLSAVGLGDVRKEDGADDAATTPHEGNGGVVELP